MLMIDRSKLGNECVWHIIDGKKVFLCGGECEAPTRYCQFASKNKRGPCHHQKIIGIKKTCLSQQAQKAAEEIDLQKN